VSITWDLQTGAAASAAFFAHNSGPIQLALDRLDAPKQAALLQDLEQLWIDNNLAADGRNHTQIRNAYLTALAIRR